MKRKISGSVFIPERCQHRTPTGRQCCSTVASATSSFCPRHSASQTEDSADFLLPLTEKACRFQNAQGVNHSLGALFTLLAQGRISPRRASVLAYIGSLLLRTLPAIDNDPYPHAGRPPAPAIIEVTQRGTPSGTARANPSTGDQPGATPALVAGSRKPNQHP